MNDKGLNLLYEIVSIGPVSLKKNIKLSIVVALFFHICGKI